MIMSEKDRIIKDIEEIFIECDQLEDKLLEDLYQQGFEDGKKDALRS